MVNIGSEVVKCKHKGWIYDGIIAEYKTEKSGKQIM